MGYYANQMLVEFFCKMKEKIAGRSVGMKKGGKGHKDSGKGMTDE